MIDPFDLAEKLDTYDNLRPMDHKEKHKVPQVFKRNNWGKIHDDKTSSRNFREERKFGEPKPTKNTFHLERKSDVSSSVKCYGC